MARSDELTKCPDHLSTDALKAEAKDAEAAAEPKTADPRLCPTYTFDFAWRDPSGKVWEGRFTNKVLTIAERQQAGVMRARMAGGLPENSLDPLTSELNLMIAHLAFSLEETEKMPEWAKDLRQVRYPRLVQALYREVSAHEAAFLGFGEDSVGGAGAGR